MAPLADLPDSLDISGAAADSVADVASSLDGAPPVALIAGVGIAAVAALAFFGGSAVMDAPSKTSTSDQDENEPEPIDVSIPYDAAAMMTYCQFKGLSSVTDKADYAAFQALYEDAAIAQVTLKKMQREVVAMEKTVEAKQKALEATKVSP